MIDDAVQKLYLKAYILSITVFTNWFSSGNWAAAGGAELFAALAAGLPDFSFLVADLTLCHFFASRGLSDKFNLKIFAYFMARDNEYCQRGIGSFKFNIVRIYLPDIGKFMEIYEAQGLAAIG